MSSKPNRFIQHFAFLLDHLTPQAQVFIASRAEPALAALPVRARGNW